MVEARRKLVDEKTAHSNQLTNQLKLYFPQMLSWSAEVDSAMTGAMLERWPTLEALQKARPETLRSFFTKHNCRNHELIEQRLDQIRKAIPATRDQALIETAVMLTGTLVKLITALREGIAAFDRQIAEAAAAHPDFVIFDSFPGAGAVMAPRLLAAFGSQRERYSSPADVQTFSGIAPVTERSGKSEWVHFRWACPIFLRQTFHEWAGHSVAYCDWARVYYEQQRARNQGHHAAVRSLAFKWIRIAFRCWKDRVPYNDAFYVESLRHRGSPLAKLLRAADNPA
jgi:transposase